MAAMAASPHLNAPAASTFASPAASTSGTSMGVRKVATKERAGAREEITLTPQVMSSFKPAKVFRDPTDREPHSVTSLCFDDSGGLLLTTGDDDEMRLYKCKEGQKADVQFSHKYGVSIGRFGHHHNTVIHNSTKTDDNALRYLDWRSKGYIRYYRGHTGRVTSMDVSPVDDTFLSGAQDDTVRLWDTRSQNCQGLLNIAGRPSVTYDPSGLIFAVTLNLKSSTLLYDIRMLDVEPFAEITIEDPIIAKKSWPPRIPIYTSAKFSSDGKYVLVGTSSGVHYVLHSFDNKVVARLEGHQGLEMYGQEADKPFAPHAGISGEETSWSSDARYVISGSNDGQIVVWDVNPPPSSAEARNRPPPGPECTLQPMKIFPGHKNTPSRVVSFNHRYGMFASGGIGELALWLPDFGENGMEGADGS